MDGPPGRCGIGKHLATNATLEFNHNDADMDKIIMIGSVAATLYPEFGLQDKTVATTDDIDDEIDDAEEVGEEELVENIDTYWGRIKMTFDERKLVDPDFFNIHMDRGEMALSNHSSMIQTACNKWYGIVDEVAAHPESSANVEGQMVLIFAMYHADNEDQELKFLHMFFKIKSCEKWREVRLALNKANKTYNSNAHVPVAAEGRPDGTKKARAARDVAPAAEQMQASIEQCIADAKSTVASREEKSDVQWSALMTKEFSGPTSSQRRGTPTWRS
ncbi:putative methionyl-tRNA synthetase [Hordeum vulgare]|nr:putative methionyl-tRNA synthetase [Hordeum vulgare]